MDDARRLPCLHTAMPAPAATKHDMVDTFRAWTRRVGAPPVPTMSTAVTSPRSIGAAAPSMASTMPDTSSTASPFMRRATM